MGTSISRGPLVIDRTRGPTRTEISYRPGSTPGMTKFPFLSISPTALRGNASGDRPTSTARVSGSRGGTDGWVMRPRTRAVLVGRSPLAFPRKAVGEIDKNGFFVIPDMLP